MSAYTEVKSRRFLFVGIEGDSTARPQLGLARQLVKRGHSVRVLADPSIEEDVNAASCTFVSFVRAPHRINRLPETMLLGD